MNVNEINLQSIKVISTTFGDLNMTLIPNFLNSLFNQTIPMLNNYLSKINV
jgi:uncharacterized protein YqhQ